MMNTTTKKAANSIVGKLTGLILSCAAAVLAGFGLPSGALAAPQSVLVVGDSLQVGTGPYLEQELRTASVEIDSRQSRRSPEGLAALRSRLRPDHSVVIFDLGTNDDPSNPDALYSAMSAARQETGDRCLVVATILRPPYNGATVEGMNAAVQRFALANPGVQVVDWYGIATSTPGILYDDGVHARPEGYALRGRLLADAVRACGGAAERGDRHSGTARRRRGARRASSRARAGAPAGPGARAQRGAAWRAHGDRVGGTARGGAGRGRHGRRPSGRRPGTARAGARRALDRASGAGRASRAPSAAPRSSPSDSGRAAPSDPRAAGRPAPSGPPGARTGTPRGAASGPPTRPPAAPPVRPAAAGCPRSARHAA